MLKMKEYVFSGPLAEPMRGYVAEKRALGCSYNTGAKMLSRFDRFSADIGCEKNILSKETVIAYAEKRENESPHTQKSRHSLLRGLADYMQRNGYEAYMLESRLYPGYWSNSYVPYIFTHDEIVRLLEQADLCESHICSPNRKHIVPLLFRLLYCCGLRSSEALSLTVGDVDVELGVLTIRNAKYDKDRLVPMTATLTERCRNYLSIVHPNSTKETPFFPNVKGEHYSERAIYDPFRIILAKAGISHGGKGNGPRVHDLRHTFSVHCLKRWVLEGADIRAKLPLLSAYLGHKKISATGQYLRLTLDLFPAITQTLENAFPDLIPRLEILPNENY